MKKFLSLMSVATVLFYVATFTACGGSDSYNVQVNANKASEGLDLKALAALTKTAKNSEDLERQLNIPLKDGGINNLDLDDNGEIDYIKVQEFGNEAAKGFSFTVDLGEGGVQEVATINIEKADNVANVNVTGNHQIYGHGATYHSSFDLGDFLLMHYLLSPHPAYVSPYHYGYYPTYYVRPRVVPIRDYHTVVRERPVYKNVVVRQVERPVYKNQAAYSVTSPNAGKTASNVKAVLTNPTTSQKEFQVKNPPRTTNVNRPSGGAFGNSNNSSTTTTRPSGGAFGSSSSSSSSSSRPSGGAFSSSRSSNSSSSSSSSSKSSSRR